MYLAVIGAIAGGLVWSFWPQPILVEMTATIRAPLRVTVDEDGKTRIRERYVVAAPLGREIAADRTGSGRPCDGRARRYWPPLSLRIPNCSIPASWPRRKHESKRRRSRCRERNRWWSGREWNCLLRRVLSSRRRELVESHADSQERLEEAEMLQRARSQDLRAAQFARDIARFELETAQAALIAVPSRRRGRSGDAISP